MFLLVTIFVAVFIASVEGVTIPGIVTTENYNHSSILDKDNNYILFWKYNSTHVTFEVHVKTAGFVGFGISNNGKMYPADVVIGWVNNGTTYFADYHTTGHVTPVRDASQDWFLLHGEEVWTGMDTRTVLKFVRKIDTCDKTDDIVIQEDTVRLIYSYNDKDPDSDTDLFYHGPGTRGTKSVSLLSEVQVPETMPSDIRHLEFLNRNFIIPNASTTYWCTGFQTPDLGGKHHMIKYEPVITPGNELNFHHVILYRCKGINSSYDGVAGNCYERDRPLPQCWDIVVAWAIGGEPFSFPSNAGFSVGGPDDPSFYIMETHYDNPTLESGRIDSSGMRLTITKNLRTHDAAMLQFGAIVNWKQIIPPFQKQYISRSYCAEYCLNNAFHESNVTQINLFAALQHAHLLGTGIKTRHFRNGTELKPIMDDPDYDFDFQQMRRLPKERALQPGDSIVVDCIYDSTGKTKPTFGGLGTHEEMCLTFGYYYPRIDLGYCLSEPELDTFTETGIQLYTLINGLDWKTPHLTSDFKSKIEASSVKHQCIKNKLGPNVVTEASFVEKPIDHPYQAPAKTCS